MLTFLEVPGYALVEFLAYFVCEVIDAMVGGGLAQCPAIVVERAAVQWLAQSTATKLLPLSPQNTKYTPHNTHGHTKYNHRYIASHT